MSPFEPTIGKWPTDVIFGGDNVMATPSIQFYGRKKKNQFTL